MDTYFIWSLVQPSHLILYAAVLGVVFWPLRLGAWCRVASAAMLIAFGLLPTAWILMRPLEQRFGFPADLERVDGIIVLAGAERAAVSALYGQPQLNGHASRLTTFMMLAERFPGAQLMHSGGGVQEHNQSDVARAILLGAGIDSSRLLFERNSRNTCDSATAARDLVQFRLGDRWLLVTSAVHMPRSVACFRAAGWAITPYPTDFARGPEPFHFGLVDNLADVDLAAHEWVGLLYYRLRGYTSEILPAPEVGSRRCATPGC